MDGILTGSTSPNQNGPGSNGNEKVLHIFQIWSFTIRRSLVSYLKHKLTLWIQHE